METEDQLQTDKCESACLQCQCVCGFSMGPTEADWLWLTLPFFIWWQISKARFDDYSVVYFDLYQTANFPKYCLF